MAVIQVKTDDWDDLKVKGPDGNVGNIGTISAYGEIISDDRVGFGDEFDYMAFTLDDAAKLSFNISADDAAKFTIYSLNSKKNKKGEFTYDTGGGKIPPPLSE